MTTDDDSAVDFVRLGRDTDAAFAVAMVLKIFGSVVIVLSAVAAIFAAAQTSQTRLTRLAAAFYLGVGGTFIGALILTAAYVLSLLAHTAIATAENSG